MGKHKVHAVIAVSPQLDGWIVDGSEMVEWDANEIGSRDINDMSIKAPPGPGVWIFDGEIVIVPRGFDDYDINIDYRGNYRRPTPDELAKIISGIRLWPWDEENPSV